MKVAGGALARAVLHTRIPAADDGDVTIGGLWNP